MEQFTISHIANGVEKLLLKETISIAMPGSDVFKSAINAYNSVNDIATETVNKDDSDSKERLFKESALSPSSTYQPVSVKTYVDRNGTHTEKTEAPGPHSIDDVVMVLECGDESYFIYSGDEVLIMNSNGSVVRRLVA